MYSQNNEETVILDALGPVPQGRFLDIGAHDGILFSNTRALVERGWSGSLFEPSPEVFQRLSANCRMYPQCSAFPYFVHPDSNPPATITFFDSGGDGVSTANPLHRDRWSRHGVHFTPIEVPVISVPQALILASGGGPEPDPAFNLISIDTESSSVDILLALVAAGVHAEVFCIEHDGRETEIRKALPHHRVILHNAENVILAL